MRIREIRERTVPISRYADPSIPGGGLTTSLVALTADLVRGGRPVTGYGFASFGRFAQGGLIRERFAPRLLAAKPAELLDEAGANVDPFRAWTVMMAGEKAGGHGERCVAVGALDMAVWDLAAKLAGEPLHRFVAAKIGKQPRDRPRVPVYASGGYIYPSDDLARLVEEERRNLDAGYGLLKIKIGSAPFATDRARIEAVLKLLPSGAKLAVDAMNAYAPAEALASRPFSRPATCCGSRTSAIRMISRRKPRRRAGTAARSRSASRSSRSPRRSSSTATAGSGATATS